MKENITLAIDGPASSGKSTVAKLIAKECGYIYIDTGAMYRALTLKALNKGCDLSNGQDLYDLLLETDIAFEKDGDRQKVLLDGKDVSDEIRQSQVSKNVSEVSSHKEVRQELVSRQQDLATDQNVVMDGRDIGTVVLPEATLKIFLEASAHERARRRYEENQKRGIQTDFETLLAEIKRRDAYDSNRKESPLKKATDAIAIDSTRLSISEVKQEILTLLEKKLK